jgi:hypothetical protein
MRIMVSLFVALVCSAAAASNSRSAVSLTGNDANPCTTSAPCRSFAAAMAQTATGGEIIAADSAGYGAFAIDRSVSVSGAPGIHAGITVTSGIAIFISAPATERVVLRNLFLIGAGAETTGIADNHLALLVISDVSASGFLGSGIDIRNTAGFIVDHCQIVDNPNSIGLSVQDSKGVVSNCMVGGNNVGIDIGDNASVSITHCDIVKNNTGMESVGFGGGDTADAIVESCSLAGNGTAVAAGSGGTGTSIVRLANAVIIGNSLGISLGPGGTVYTYGNNEINGNFTDGTGSMTNLGRE